MVEEGKEPPFHLLMQFLSALPSDDIFSQAPQLLTPKQLEVLSPKFQDIEPIREFYHQWKEILIEALILRHEERATDSSEGQELAKL